MGGLSLDTYHWKLVHHLVAYDHMTVFKVESNEKEIWLEKEDAKKLTVIRIIRKDMDWGSYIARDIDTLVSKAEKVRKELRGRHLKVINVYLSRFLPIDETDRNIFQLKTKRITIDSLIIDSEKGNVIGIPLLKEKLQQDIPALFEPEIEENYSEIAQQYRSQVVTICDKKLNKEKRIFTYGKPFFTFLMLVNVLVIFALMEFFGSSTSLLTLVEFGAKYDPLIHQGEWWRFFTAIFLHIGFLHLFMNCLALFYLGSAVERIYGTPRFVFIYLVAGLFGSISSFAFNSQVSAGASGAIFGCFGALLYFGIVYRKLFFRTMGLNIIVILIINLALGFMIPMIDNSAHIGGLVGGFLASAIFHLPNHNQKQHRLASSFVTIVAIGGLLLLGFSTEEDKEKMHLINIQIAQELLQRGEIERAYPLLKGAVEYEVDVIEANFLLAYSEARLGLLKDAERNLLLTIDQRPFLHEAHFNLSLVYFEMRQYLDAYRSVEKALELKPNSEDYANLKNTIEKVLEKLM